MPAGTCVDEYTKFVCQTQIIFSVKWFQIWDFGPDFIFSRPWRPDLGTTHVTPFSKPCSVDFILVFHGWYLKISLSSLSINSIPTLNKTVSVRQSRCQKIRREYRAGLSGKRKWKYLNMYVILMETMVSVGGSLNVALLCLAPYLFP